MARQLWSARRAYMHTSGKSLSHPARAAIMCASGAAACAVHAGVSAHVRQRAREMQSASCSQM
jgi:hypothetical protein